MSRLHFRFTLQLVSPAAIFASTAGNEAHLACYAWCFWVERRARTFALSQMRSNYIKPKADISNRNQIQIEWRSFRWLLNAFCREVKQSSMHYWASKKLRYLHANTSPYSLKYRTIITLQKKRCSLNKMAPTPPSCFLAMYVHAALFLKYFQRERPQKKIWHSHGA